MKPSTAMAQVVVDQFVRSGVGDVVLSPGSRSAPLALELAAAERRGEVRLHVRIDERSAGYLALGIARVSLAPVLVVCTSGTAVANLMPAVVEASYAGVPLIAVTADRPSELRNTGANQTIDQVGFFGANVRRAADLPAAVDRVGQVELWRSQVARCVDSALGRSSSDTGYGPVHLNLGFRSPLVPDGDHHWCEPLAAGWPNSAPPELALAEPINYAIGDLGLDRVPSRGVVLVGDVVDPADSLAAIQLAQACGWPLISEPSGNALIGATALPAASLLLADPDFARDHVPELVVTVGRFGIDRSVLGLVALADLHLAVSLGGRDRPDPTRTAAGILPAVPLPPINDPVIKWGGPSPDWAREWRVSADAVAKAVSVGIAAAGFSGLQVALTSWQVLDRDDLLFVASSRAVRDLEIIAQPRPNSPRTIGNRGASGIDGLISTAWGAAIAHSRCQLASRPAGRAIAVMGDLAFLHDHNGLLVPKCEQLPDLTLVVVDNNGGGIFSALEQGAPEFAADFERIFGTPHDLDLAAIARATGTATYEVCSQSELDDALAATVGGVNVIVARTQDRAAEERLHRQLQRAASAALCTRDCQLPANSNAGRLEE